MDFSDRFSRFLQSKKMEDKSDIISFTITNNSGEVVPAGSTAADSAAGRRDGVEEGSSTRLVEHMFDKVVTPSDVGKLNRLVIPKQHAERYFPLDIDSNEKGQILNFEDGSGKSWRFRYSYWNSSQSYVMTKGWSRFVKEKRLDAGDTVSFERGVGSSGETTLFISWKRRQNAPGNHLIMRPPLGSRLFWPVMPGGRPLLRPDYYDYCSYGFRCTEPTPSPCYLREINASQLAERRDSSSLVVRDGLPETGTFKSEMTINPFKAAAKSVRLFGVNLIQLPTAMEEGENEESWSSNGCGGDGDGLICSSSMTNGVSQSPSHLQLRLHVGDDSQFAMSTNPRPVLSRKQKTTSLSFD